MHFFAAVAECAPDNLTAEEGLAEGVFAAITPVAGLSTTVHARPPHPAHSLIVLSDGSNPCHNVCTAGDAMDAPVLLLVVFAAIVLGVAGCAAECGCQPTRTACARVVIHGNLCVV
jgi:hypothetical protein